MWIDDCARAAIAHPNRHFDNVVGRSAARLDDASKVGEHRDYLCLQVTTHFTGSGVDSRDPARGYQVANPRRGRNWGGAVTEALDLDAFASAHNRPAYSNRSQNPR